METCHEEECETYHPKVEAAPPPVLSILDSNELLKLIELRNYDENLILKIIKVKPSIILKLPISKITPTIATETVKVNPLYLKSIPSTKRSLDTYIEAFKKEPNVKCVIDGPMVMDILKKLKNEPNPDRFWNLI